MAVTDQAFVDVVSGETSETTALTGNIWFRYAGGEEAFKVSRVEVDMVYTPERFVKWAVHLPVEPGALPGIMPLLVSLGSSDGEVLNLPLDQQMEVTMSVKPDVLERLSPELVRADKLSVMFQSCSLALLDLDNYEQGAYRIATVPEIEGAD